MSSKYAPEPPFTGKEYECAKCGDKIHSRYSGEFVTCKCGAISVDSTPYYTRFIGNPQDFKHIRDDNSSTNKD